MSTEKENKNKEILEVVFKEGINSSMSHEVNMAASFLETIKEGEAIFTYSKVGDIFQVSIYSNVNLIDDKWIPNPDDYSVSIITQEYTVAFKHVNLKYLKNQVYNKMKESNVEKNILEDYKQMIKSIETKIEKK